MDGPRGRLLLAVNNVEFFLTKLPVYTKKNVCSRVKTNIARTVHECSNTHPQLEKTTSLGIQKIKKTAHLD